MHFNYQTIHIFVMAGLIVGILFALFFIYTTVENEWIRSTLANRFLPNKNLCAHQETIIVICLIKYKEN